MKSFNINLAHDLKNIEITVNNGRKFTDAAIRGEYENFNIKVSPADLKRIKKFAIKNGTDNSSNHGKWYAHCNGFAMGLFVNYDGRVAINTYSDFRKNKPC